MKIESTVVRSYGEAQQREAVAFWLMALLKGNKNMDLIDQCVKYIQDGRKNGGFGNSQTTSICLQALTKYAHLFMAKSGIEGRFCLAVNSDSAECKDIKTAIKQNKNRLAFEFAKKLKKGQNTIRVDLAGCSTKYPYEVNIRWQSSTPPSSAGCPLKLTATLSAKTVKVNETVRLSVRLQNIKKEGIPMSVAVIGIPGGMSLQPWQLKELQDKAVFDFYEIIDDNLGIYYRELGPSETKTVNLDLKAEVTGRYKGIASSAYQYYMQDFKCWIEGLTVDVE